MWQSDNDAYLHFIIRNGVKWFVLCEKAFGGELKLLISSINSGPYFGEVQSPLILSKISYLHLQRCKQ